MRRPVTVIKKPRASKGAEDTLKTVQADIVKHEKIREDVKLGIVEKQKERDNVTEDLVRVRNLIIESGEENSDLIEKTRVNRRAILETEEGLKELESQKELILKDTEEAQRDNNCAKVEWMKEQEKEVNKKSSEISTLTEEVENLNTELEQRKKEKLEIDNGIDSQLTRIPELEDGIVKLELDGSKLETELVSAKEQFKLIELDIKKNNGELSKLDTKLVEKTKKLEQLGLDIIDAEKKSKSVISSALATEERVDNKIKEVKALIKKAQSDGYLKKEITL